jgi:hypothetical protein
MARYQLNEPDVIQEIIDGEALIVHTRTGSYYSLLGSGVRIWEGLLGGMSVEQTARQFTTSDQVGLEGIREQVEQFIAQLLADELIRPDQRPEASAPELSQPLAFETPVLQKFTDMQELLLVDPIHEVDPEAGWPLPPDQA